MKKKLIALLSVLTVAFSLTACSLGELGLGIIPNNSNTASGTNTDSVTDTDTGTNGGGNQADGYTYQSFTKSEQKLFNDNFGFVIPFVSNNEYYVQDERADYYPDEYVAIISYYTVGNTQEEFNAYKALFTTANGYTDDGTAEPYPDRLFLKSSW